MTSIRRRARTLGLVQRSAVHRLLLLALLGLNVWVFAGVLPGVLPAREPAPAADRDAVPRMIVLVFDGVDYRMAKAYMEAGKLQNLARLARTGGFHRLMSELPPESPVALASMLTGVNPGIHRLFDFVGRGFDDRPENGMVEIVRARLVGRVPVRPPRIRSRLKAPTFTELCWKAGYSVLSLRQPLLFPAPHRPGALMTTGLGTPDLAGSAGFYSIYSDRLRFEEGNTIFGGMRVPLNATEGATHYDTFVWGPQDPSLGLGRLGERQRAKVPMRVEPASEEGRRGVRLVLQGESAFVPEGERSAFFSVEFPLNTIPTRSLPGIVRFEVLNVSPIELLMDPVQIDPRAPILSLSTEPGYGKQLWEQYGPYETTGWREQTFALNDRFQDDEGFLRDLLEDLDQGAHTLLSEMKRVRKGHKRPARCVFYTFTATDRACHCFYRHRDRGHPAHDPAARFAKEDPILTVFERMDKIVGDVVAQLEEDDVLLIASDHGFQTWRWEVQVNQWLVDNGYLVLTEDAREKNLTNFFGGARESDGVDWSKTRAFALGLGQVYLNLKGRDRVGVVDPSEKRALMEELKTALEGLKNPYLTDEDRRDGIPEKCIREVSILEDVWDFGDAEPPAHVPDLQIGFENGYRISWQTALLGGMKARGDVFKKNLWPWSGDHCSTHPDLVPGILFSNRPIPRPRARPYHVRDIAATVLAHFGLDRSHLRGESQPIPLIPLGASR